MPEEIGKPVVQEQEDICGAIGEKRNHVCAFLCLYTSILLDIIASLALHFSSP